MNDLMCKIIEIVKFLDRFKSVANAHTVDFILTEQWDKLIPREIADELDMVSSSNNLDNSTNFYDQLDGKHPHCMKFMEDCQKYSLNVKEFSNYIKSSSLDMNSNLKIHGFMNSKKQHEVTNLTKIVCKLLSENKLDLIVDVGSGKGYFSSNVSLESKVKVVGIDSCFENSNGAVERMRKMNRVLKHSIKQSNSKVQEIHEHYRTVTGYFNSRTDLKEIVPEVETCDMMLTGLHSCGNLSSSMLKIFSATNIKSLCLVGCCYHHIEEEYFKCPFDDNSSDVQPDPGFPLSSVLKGMKYALGRNARMLACQSIERVKSGKISASESLFNRALLQVILHKKLGHDFMIKKDIQIGSKIFKKSSCFKDYVKKSWKKISIEDENPISDEEIDFYENQYAPYKDKIYKFYYLRVLLAPVIETLILLDRLYYLKEQRNVEEAYLVKLFDPVISPRCYAIIAHKDNL